MNNFEDIVNRRVDIREDIKGYQDTLSYALSKVDYSVGEHLYMLPSDMALKIRPGTVGYNNKILVSDEKFILGKNDEVNLAVPAMKSHKTNSLIEIWSKLRFSILFLRKNIEIAENRMILTLIFSTIP